MLTEEAKQRMLDDLSDRIEANARMERVNNADLPAGSPMHYYCQLCKALADVLPEEHDCSPAKYCVPCEEMVLNDFDPRTKKFVVTEAITCTQCGGSGLGVYDYYLRRRRRCCRCGGNCKIKVTREV